MKRFLFLFILGALMIIIGQVSLGLGLHPERLASLRFLAQSSLGLILGSAVIASGMMGLAEGYENIADRMAQLLGTKQQDENLELAVRHPANLDDHSRIFWKAYAYSAGSVCLFLAGFLGSSLVFAKLGFLLYLMGLGGSVAILGMLSLFLGYRALRALRRTYRTVEDSALILAAQPDRIPEEEDDPEAGISWTVRRRPQSRYARHLDIRRRLSTTRVRR